MLFHSGRTTIKCILKIIAHLSVVLIVAKGRFTAKKLKLLAKTMYAVTCLFNFFDTAFQFQKSFKENTCLFFQRITKPQVSGVKLWHEAFPSVNLQSPNIDLLQLLTKLQPQGCKSPYSSLIDRIYHDWLCLWTTSIPMELLHNSNLDENRVWESYIQLLWKTIQTVLICT